MNPSKLIIITPVKDSLDTTKETIEHIYRAEGNYSYYIFNDFSSEGTENWLSKNQELKNFTLVNLGDHVDTPSPNYKTVLQMSRKMALDSDAHLLIVESDVMVSKDTIRNLAELATGLDNPGLIGSVTVDTEGKINFPYNHVKDDDPDLFVTDRSLSFCCTLLTHSFLENFDFAELNTEKDWYDVFISKKSRKLGYDNYLAKNLPVIHKPHSSRPWKQEKYTNPFRYYFKKFFLKRDRI